MIRHYLSVTIRNLRSAPFVAAANGLTLALGLLCFVTALAIVRFLDQSEQQFPKADRTYVITTNLRYPDGIATTGTMYLTNPHIAEYLKIDFPDVETVARARVWNEYAAVSSGDRAVRLFGVFVDPAILEIFDFTFLRGNPNRALNEPRSVVLTEEAAQRLFGDQDPVGRGLVLANTLQATVTGVIEAVQEPSHMGRSDAAALPFELLASYDLYDALVANALPQGVPSPPEDWINVRCTTYVLLPEDGSLSAEDLGPQLNDFASRHAPAEQLSRAQVELGMVPIGALLAMAWSEDLFLSYGGVDVSQVLLFLGGLLLAVACVNYANLATVRALRRAREVGLRKAMGAKTRQITVQYLLEVSTLTTVSLLIAVVALLLLRPVLNAALGIDLQTPLFSGLDLWISLLMLLVVVTLVAGAYPAFVLSRILPASALRLGDVRKGAGMLASLLVAVQFTVTSFLLIAVVVVSQQNTALERTGFGLAVDPLVVIENRSAVSGVEPETLRNELMQVPQVIAVTDMMAPPWGGQRMMQLTRTPDASTIQRSATLYTVGYDFFSMFRISVVAGRVFDPAYGEDAIPWRRDQPNSLVIDVNLAEQLGFAKPEDAVGELLYLPQGNARGVPFRVIGVVQERMLTLLSADSGVMSSVYGFGAQLSFQVVHLSATDVAGALDRIDRVWQRLVPNVAIQRRFLDDIFNDTYENFARIVTMFSALSVVALVISVMGLFAITLLAIRRRSKEIAIRRAVGARVSQVLLLLVRQFSKPVLIASVAAWPLAYISARAYLDLFIDPIALTLLPFAVALVVTLAVVWAVVSAQALRATSMQPAEVLRSQ